jgi:hypothetical protein
MLNEVAFVTSQFNSFSSPKRLYEYVRVKAPIVGAPLPLDEDELLELEDDELLEEELELLLEAEPEPFELPEPPPPHPAKNSETKTEARAKLWRRSMEVFFADLPVNTT